jgi:hypothetical protein
MRYLRRISVSPRPARIAAKQALPASFRLVVVVSGLRAKREIVDCGENHVDVRCV